jgi:hypothetical protein
MTPRIPIIGQPEITDYFLCLQVQCSCGHQLLIVGLIGAVRQCAECKRLYRLNGMPSLDAHGNIQAPLGVATVASNPKETPAP